MSIDYTTDGMIDSIKLRGVLPDSQNLFMPEDIVGLMTNELHSIIVPKIMSMREEYLVASYDQDIDAGETAFFIPFRSVGLKLRDVVLVDSGGQEIPLRRYEPEDLKNGYQTSGGMGFYLDNDRVLLLPTDTDFSAYTFRAKIFRRPNNLVRASDAAQITAINTGTRVVTCATMPSHFTTSLTYDFIKGTPSFRAHAEAQAITTKSGFDLTFSSTLPTDLAVGDWVAETGFSPIPQIPYELHRLLEQRTVMKILEGLKDKTGLELAKDAYKEMVAEIFPMVTPRADGAPQKLVSRRGIRAYNRGLMWG